jgi:hypothetical protein
MADDFNTGTEAAPTTSAPGDIALATLAKDESADAYIAERQSQQAEEQGQPETPNGADRSNKLEAALEEARARSRQAREQEYALDQGLEHAEREWQAQQQQEQFQQQQVAQALTHHEARGRCMERAEQLKRSNPTLHKTITDNLMLLESVLDPDQARVLEAALIYHTPALWRLAENLSNDDVKVPGGETMADKLDLIRRAAPQELWNAINQGAAAFQQEAYVQRRILEDRVAQGRRVTSAPPPIVPPRGSANVPRDMFRTAEKSDATDYVKMRRAQMARDAREDR